ncbi:uncharacterized protein EI90DRAFT_3117280 [Cantharellus anzutake]|uniref:uncharacterized protein n=1 Tax=Cantharellus anzutake TaxID=1750568 RepID=UPI001905CF2F|nr:uncharacterized protein EI90DRAFT_3117280 [Cantharellus anzutake]KAF8340736.1 hypothetical protein EI90DRAFT_3117280 [Cantharellus anzutake]
MASPQKAITDLDANAVATSADQRADKLGMKQIMPVRTCLVIMENFVDDTIHLITDPFEKAKSFYSKNSDTIHATIQLFTGGSTTGKIIDGWLGTVDRVVNGLDELAKSSPFPFIGPAILLLSAVVKLETQRRENSRRTRALILQMADMLSALLQLHFVQDPELEDAKGQSVQGRIQALMEDIKKDIQDCGNLIDTYHKHSLTSKFFFSGSYATKFSAKASSLVNRKSDIIFALQIHNTVNIDAIRAEVTDTNAMLKKLIDVVSHKSEWHIRYEQAMNDFGGRKKVLGNDGLLTSMATMIQVGMTKDEMTAQTANVAGREMLGGVSVLSAREMHELRLPLDAILAQNAGYFSKKLDAQMEAISNQLDKVQHSTTQILRTITGGAYERIVHPIIRHIWKEMVRQNHELLFVVRLTLAHKGWHANVKARTFVMTLHDYFLDMFAHTLGASIIGVGGNFSMANQIDLTGGDAETSVDASTGTTCLDGASDLADKWCLQFLNPRYVTSIMEAFDDDSSGYVRVSKVNDFTNSIPKGWSLLQWLAYWARGRIVPTSFVVFLSHAEPLLQGWRVETSIYAQLIHALLSQMRGLANTAHVANSRIIQGYFHGRWVLELNRLVKCTMFKNRDFTNTPLDDLIKARIEEKRERLVPALQRLYFDLDDVESLELIKEPGRIEKDLFAILYLVLLRHASMMKLAKTVILDDREFTEASTTLSCIFDAIHVRLSDLEESQKGHGMDAAHFIARYAGGIYEFLYQKNVPDNLGGIVNDDAVEGVAAILEKSSIDVKDLRFGPWHLDTSGYEEEPEPEIEQVQDETMPPLAPGSPVLIRRASISGEAYVRQVISQLELLTADERFKFVKPSVSMLRSIADAEYERWLKTDIPRALIAQMADVLHTLLQLRHMDNLELVTDCGVTNISRTQDVVRHIEKDLKDCGYLIRMYHKTNVSRENAMAIYLQQRAERLLLRKNDLIAAMSISYMKSLERFRALGRTIVQRIREKRQRLRWEFYRNRRDVRNEYVSLVAKQLQCAETRAIWHVGISLTPEEEERLKDLSDNLSDADWAYYQSLARLKYRLTRAHLNLVCCNCGKIPVIGKAYQCILCTSVSFCEECERTTPSGIQDAIGKPHLSSHPLLQISRPVVQISNTELEDITRMYERLVHCKQDSDESDSDAQWSDGDADLESSDEDLAGVHFQSTSSSIRESPLELARQKTWEFAAMKVKLEHAVNDHKGEGLSPRCIRELGYKCSHCHKGYTGVRFILVSRYRGKHLCPKCEQELSARYENDPLPAHLLLLLKYTLPGVETPTPTVVGALGGDHDLQQDERVQALEDKLGRVEEKLNLLLSLLNAENRPTWALMTD